MLNYNGMDNCFSFETLGTNEYLIIYQELLANHSLEAQ